MQCELNVLIVKILCNSPQEAALSFDVLVRLQTRNAVEEWRTVDHLSRQVMTVFVQSTEECLGRQLQAYRERVK